MYQQQAPKREQIKQNQANTLETDLASFLDSDEQLKGLEAQKKDIYGKINNVIKRPNPSELAGLKGMQSIIGAEISKRTLELQKQFGNNPSIFKKSEPEPTSIDNDYGQEGRNFDRIANMTSNIQERQEELSAGKIADDKSVWGNPGATGGSTRKDIGQKPVN